MQVNRSFKAKSHSLPNDAVPLLQSYSAADFKAIWKLKLKESFRKKIPQEIPIASFAIDDSIVYLLIIERL